MVSLLLAAGVGSIPEAIARSETRTLSFHHTHSGEDLTVTFKRDGRYDEAALKRLNHYFRDWRTQDETAMDPRLFDILWEVYRDVDGRQPIQIISAYRSPASNAMLRRRSSSVARESQHTLGHAMDIFIPGVPLEQVRNAALRQQHGGVGYYPGSGSPFVHLDTGSIRHWPRMTHDELARVFPDGRTVHIPSDGVPLRGYELARADLEKRGTGMGSATSGKPNFLAALFKGNSANSEDEDDEAAAPPLKAAVAHNDNKVTGKLADSVPMPRAKPRAIATLQLASADAQTVQSAGPVAKDLAKDLAKNSAKNLAEGTRQATPDDAATLRARQALASALKARQAVAADSDPESTASFPPSTYNAMAYAPVAISSAKIVADTAPPPRSVRSASATRSLATEPGNALAAKESQTGSQTPITASTRISTVQGNGIWVKIVTLAPSASRSMSVTLLGDVDMNAMRAYFVKPRAVVAMGFADDPMPGMSCANFSGSTATKLKMTPFVVGTAAR